MHPFRAAIEARDIDAAIALLADDVEFRSPIVYAPYQGRDSVGELIRGVARVFKNFRYVREIGAESGRNHALVFSARVGDKEVEGCDLIRCHEDGSIAELVVMVRPLSSALALVQEMHGQISIDSRT